MATVILGVSFGLICIFFKLLNNNINGNIYYERFSYLNILTLYSYLSIHFLFYTHSSFFISNFYLSLKNSWNQVGFMESISLGGVVVKIWIENIFFRIIILKKYSSECRIRIQRKNITFSAYFWLKSKSIIGMSLP